MANVNPGPASTANPNLQAPISGERTIQTIAVAITPVATATITVAEQSFGANGVSFVTAATGILPGDVILAVNPPSTVAGVGVSQARVDTAVADKFYVAFVNPTAGSLTMPSGIYLITVARYNTSVGTSTPNVFSGLPTSLY
jgi:hypothetical protein